MASSYHIPSLFSENQADCVVLNDGVFPSWRHDCLPLLGKCLGVKTLINLRRNKACSQLHLGYDRHLSPAAGPVSASAETHFLFALPTIQLFSCALSWNCCPQGFIKGSQLNCLGVCKDQFDCCGSLPLNQTSGGKMLRLKGKCGLGCCKNSSDGRG